MLVATVLSVALANIYKLYVKHGTNAWCASYACARIRSSRFARVRIGVAEARISSLRRKEEVEKYSCSIAIASVPSALVYLETHRGAQNSDSTMYIRCMLASTVLARPSPSWLSHVRKVSSNVFLRTHILYRSRSISQKFIVYAMQKFLTHFCRHFYRLTRLLFNF